MSWNTSQLSCEYQRSIIGYDLRYKAVDYDYFSSNHFSCLDIKTKKFPATIDNQVWPEIDDKYEIDSQCNGFNLYDNLDDEIQRKAQHEDVILVAFDIPTELADGLYSTFGLLPIPLETVPKEHELSFLGYDIVDIRTQNSAIYSFNWTEDEIKTIFQKLSISLNTCGLVHSVVDALRISSDFDKMIPEHSPFVPCGIWIKKKSEEGS